MSLISVIVPVYNVEPYLARCVDSILKQTYPEFELILVDDGSLDACPQICDRYAEQDRRVRVIHKENGGLSDARNAGYAICKGEYVAFVDSDDWVAEDYLEQMLRALNETDCDICECEAIRVSGEAETAENRATGGFAVYRKEDALESLIRDGAFHQHVWNKLYKKACIGEIQFETGRINEDEFWTYQVFGQAERVVRIQQVLYYYFQRPGSIMGMGYSIKRLDALEAKSRRQDYVEERFPKLADTARANLFGSCIYSGQMVLRHLKADEQKKAKQRINRILKKHELKRSCRLEAFSVDEKKWVVLAKGSFWGTCRLKNALNKGF